METQDNEIERDAMGEASSLASMLADKKNKIDKAKEIKSKIDMEVEAFNSNGLAEQIESKKQELADMEAQISDLRIGLGALEVALKDEEEDHAQKMTELLTDPNYLTPDQLEKLENELDSVKKKFGTILETNSSMPNSIEEISELNCVVCLAVPKDSVFSCNTCEAIYCNNCVDQLQSCGVCRASFNGDRPKRNRTAERLINRLT